VSRRRKNIPAIAEIAAVVFDLDGVLLDSEPHHFRAASRVFAAEGKVLSQAVYRKFIGCGAQETWTAWKMQHALAGSVAELIALDEEARLLEIGRGVEAIPAAIHLARRFSDGGQALAIASSSTPETIDAELRALGVEDLFELRVSGEHVSRSKPAPDVYLRAADLLGVEPRRCLAIEDSPVGVAAAKAAGMTCVAVPTDWTRDGDFSLADATLESLSYFPLLMIDS
jgi:beta-phosphoglucomutase-like phosphatase (HAD superfamily)